MKKISPQLALALVSSVLLVLCLAVLAFVEIPEGNREAFLPFVGMVGSLTQMAWSFWFVTTKSSETKNETIRNLTGPRE